MLTVAFYKFEEKTFDKWFRYHFELITSAIHAKDCNLLIVRFDKLRLAYIQLSSIYVYYLSALYVI